MSSPIIIKDIKPRVSDLRYPKLNKITKARGRDIEVIPVIIFKIFCFIPFTILLVCHDEYVNRGI